MGPGAGAVSVLLADDMADVRLLLRAALQLEDRFEVVGEATNGEQCLELADQLRPNAVVLDPFCGTGTTALLCSERGIECDTTDINPFLIWLANAKCNSYSAAELDAKIAELTEEQEQEFELLQEVLDARVDNMRFRDALARLRQFRAEQEAA